MTWFLDDLNRLARERAGVRDLQSTCAWLTGVRWWIEHGQLCLDAVIDVRGREYPVRMTYPEFFPALPPVVRPVQEGARWSEHQFPDGSLCLEWGPDTWHPEVTSMQMLESTYRLLDAESPGGHSVAGPVPSRHRLSDGQSLRGRVGRVHFGRGLREYLGRLPHGLQAVADFHIVFQSNSFLVVVQTVRAAGFDPWQEETLPRSLRRDADSPLLYRALVGKISAEAPVLLGIADVPKLDALLLQQGFGQMALLEDGSDSPAGAVIVGADASPHFFIRWDRGDALQRLAPVYTDWQDPSLRMPTEYLALSERLVGIVGLGSVGSKVAVSLARMGLGRFFLVDEDIFLPENAARHTLDLHSIGEHKVDGVAEQIRRVSTTAEVGVSRVHLTGQESNAVVAGVLEKLGRCDVLVDATADPKVFGLLDAVAAAESKPLVWMEVFAGGIGGMIARSRPGKDPRPFTMRRAYHQFCAEQPPPQGLLVRDYTIEAQDEILTATDADVSVVAALSAEVAADALLNREPSRFPHSMYLIGLARGWAFDAPLQVIPIATDHLIDEQRPPLGEDDVNAVAEQLEFIGDLIRQKRHDDHRPEKHS